MTVNELIKFLEAAVLTGHVNGDADVHVCDVRAMDYDTAPVKYVTALDGGEMLAIMYRKD